jgi:hypothetical protein
MQDLKEKREQFLVAATDCELIGHLTPDSFKHDAFLRLAEQLRRMADDIGAVIAAREAKEAA